MATNGNVSPNNIINLTPEDFYKIIRGENHHYIYASTNSMAGARYEEERRADLGIPSFYPVNIPEMWYRHRPEQKYSMVPYEKWPDFSKPIINRIQGSIHFVYNIHPIWENQLLDIKKKLVRGININYCEFYGVVVWNEVASDSFLSFNNCNFFSNEDNGSINNNSLMRFSNSAFTNVNFVDCPSHLLTNSYCLEYLYIDSLVTDIIRIENSAISKVVINGEKSNIKKIVIKNSIIEELSIEGGSIIECSIVNLQSSNFIKFDTEFEIINISNELVESSNNKTIINNIEVKFRNQAGKGSFSITKEALVNNINFSGINNGNVVIQQKSIDVFEAENFSNTGDVRFENIKSINKFILRGTTLGGTKFVNVDLSTSKLLQIVDSSFSEIQLINTFIPGNIVGESDVDFTGIREVYRQLKYASSKQGDRIRELEYEALEMQAFTNDTTTPKTKMDELILWSNGWSNRHGQDAYIALYRLIPVTVVVYIMIKLCQGCEFNIEYFGDTFSEYMNFAFNPLHDYNKVFETDTSITQNTHTFWIGLAKTLDTLIRIYSGYLIFQFLRAFRKYAK